jgi:hypothetical protein
MDDTSKTKEKNDMGASISTAAAIKLRHAQRLTSLESQHRLTNLTQHPTHESKTKCSLLYAKGHSAQSDMFWMTHHIKPEQKSIGVMPLCLWVV